MKTNLLDLVLIFGVTMMALGCSHDEMTEQLIVTEAELIGEWRSSNTLINGIPLVDFTGPTYSIFNIFWT